MKKATKKTKKGKGKPPTFLERRKLPKKTGRVNIHVPDWEWDEVSRCHGVRMYWKHLICIPDAGDSISELEALRVCKRCLKSSRAYYNLTD